jgi:hypothetical protein
MPTWYRSHKKATLDATERDYDCSIARLFSTGNLEIARFWGPLRIKFTCKSLALCLMLETTS